MSTHGDFIDFRTFRGCSSANPEKGDFAPLGQLTRKKVTFGSLGMSHAGINVTFGRAVTRKKVTVKQGN